MSEIKIEYYGHSCFRISCAGSRVVLDPYEDDSVPGLKLPEGIKADAVYCSHDHKDHNASHLIQTTGINPFPYFKTPVPHDEVNGAKRGLSDITFLKVSTITIVHLGDIGREPTEEEYEALARADVMMVPAGGHFTIDAAMAAKIIKRVHARLNILMHYRREDSGYDVLADLAAVKKSFPELKELPQTSITFEETEIPAETIVLEPIQAAK